MALAEAPGTMWSNRRHLAFFPIALVPAVLAAGCRTDRIPSTEDVVVSRRAAVFTLFVVTQEHDCPFHPADTADILGPLPDHGCKSRSLGTGFLFEPPNLALTNHHVVERAVLAEAAFEDGRKRPVQILGTDPETDLALLRIGGEGPLPDPVPIGRPAGLRVGDRVYSIGSPLGLGGTLAVGIVSDTQRILAGQSWVAFLQSTVGLHPGNSGGPLLDGEGRAVGVNAALVHSEGLGLSIPIDVALRIAGALRQNGRVERGSLGIRTQSLDSGLAEALGLKVGRGVLVTDVLADGPAEVAGLHPGEAIVEINEKAVDSERAFEQDVASLPAGSTALVSVASPSGPRAVRVSVVPRPSPGRRGTSVLLTSPLGMSLVDGPGGLPGALILDVEPGGPADRAGLSINDMVVEAGRQPIRNLADVRAAVAPFVTGGEPLLIRVRRGAIHRFAVLRRASSGDR